MVQLYRIQIYNIRFSDLQPHSHTSRLIPSMTVVHFDLPDAYLWNRLAITVSTSLKKHFSLVDIAAVPLRKALHIFP